MITTVIIAIITCISLITSIICFPKVKIFNKTINTYWGIGIIGALLMVVFNCIDIKEIFEGLLSKSNINPIKILILFISMTCVKVYKDYYESRELTRLT